MHPELASGPEQSDAAPLAYSVDQLPYGRTYVYELIRQGKLKAKKSGRRTLITAEAWKEHLASLPDLETSAAKRKPPGPKAPAARIT